MAGEQKKINKDVKEVIKEISKAPGGNVSQQRPLVPGGIQGGPSAPAPVPGAVQKEPEGPFVKRDIAREAFKSFKTGETKAESIPSPKPDTKKVETTKIEPTGKKGYRGRQEQLKTNQGVREGTIRGMTREPGSKPPLSKSLPMAIEIAAERARRRETIETIQELLRDQLTIERSSGSTTYRTAPGTPSSSMISREEAKMIELIARRMADATEELDAAMREQAMMRDLLSGQVNPLAAGVVQSEADRRVQEGLNRLNPPTMGGKGAATLGLLGIGADAYFMWKQLLAETAQRKKQLKSEAMN